MKKRRRYKVNLKAIEETIMERHEYLKKAQEARDYLRQQANVILVDTPQGTRYYFVNR